MQSSHNGQADNLTLPRLCVALVCLEAAFVAKASEFATVLKMGRTQLQDAVPMTLGQAPVYSIILNRSLNPRGGASAG